MIELPQEMRAVEIMAAGGPENLRQTTRPLPVTGYGEVLIRVSYAGVNRPDIFQRMGFYPVPAGASDLPGLEVSGHIAAIGPGVTGLAVGDAVCALTPGGGYAEYVAVPAGHCLPVPAGMDLLQAGGLCETAYTVWSNVVMRGGLAAGEKFLVHGGSSGIGTMAIQLGVALGARVFATAGSDDKCAACAGLGAEAINYRDSDFAEILKADGGVNLILDMVGGAYLDKNLRSLQDDGRLVLIAHLKGAKAEADLGQIMRRRLTVTGSTLRPQSDAAKSAIAEQLRAQVWPLIEAGHIRILVDSQFDLADAGLAHERMESSAHIGKIILKVA